MFPYLLVGMMTRKVQQYGKDSLGITLPRQYLAAKGIGKGDPMEIQILHDGSLRIAPAENDHEGRGVSSTDAPRQALPASNDQGGFD